MELFDWAQLLRLDRRDARAFACLCAWRYVVLSRKNRFCVVVKRERLWIDFFKAQLPLHMVAHVVDKHDTEPRFALLQYLLALLPVSATTQTDSHVRALGYALQTHWSVDQLSWLVHRSSNKLQDKDAEGFSLVHHAIANRCAPQTTRLLAVEIAKYCIVSVDRLRRETQTREAKRFCQRMVLDFFAGVPQFPYASCRLSLQQPDANAVVSSIYSVWNAFIDKWGYAGPPLIQKDLADVLQAPVDSFVQLCVSAQGEPLSYQWYFDGAKLDGATQSDLCVAHNVQPCNEGEYWCEITNWKGRIMSQVLVLQVVEDQIETDPFRKYRIDHSALIISGHAARVVDPALGALIHHPIAGVTLLLPPHCLPVMSSAAREEGDTEGFLLEIGLLATSEQLDLAYGDTLVSAIVNIVPESIDTLQRLALLSIPHSWSVQNDPLHELVVIHVPDSTRSEYEPIEILNTIERSSMQHALRVLVHRLGRYAVICRSLPSNLQREHPLEEVVIFLVHPSRLSLHRLQQQVISSLWLAQRRPDCVVHTKAAIERLLTSLSPDFSKEDWSMASFRLSLRQTQVLCIRIGKQLFVHQWMRPARGSSINQSQCVAKALSFCPFDMMESLQSESYPTFCELPIQLTVRKPHGHLSVEGSKLASDSHSRIISESFWNVIVPVSYDVVAMTPKPVVQQRTGSKLVLDFTAIVSMTPPSSSSSSTRSHALSKTYESRKPVIELHVVETDEARREFTPFFYVVEMAKFAPSFWLRYDQTWWFDKTKTKIIDGMYKVVHMGIDPFAIIGTDAYAGCFRVAQCSIDQYGQYSDVLLLEPPNIAVCTNELAAMVDSDDEDQLRVFKLMPVNDLSRGLTDSVERLHRVLSAVYCSDEDFQSLFGLAKEPISRVVDALESFRQRHRAANREIALMMLAFERLGFHVAQINVRPIREWVELLLAGLRRVTRLLAELDCFPSTFSTVIVRFHGVIQEFYVAVSRLSLKGWLHRFLMHDWQESEFQSVLNGLIDSLCTDASTLVGADTVLHDLQALLRRMFPVDCSDLRCAADLIRAQAFFLLRHSEDNPAISHQTANEFAQALQWDCLDKSEVDGLYDEISSQMTQDALKSIHADDTLANHILRLVPNDREVCARPPERITMRFDMHVKAVHSVLQVVKITNQTIHANLHGEVRFDVRTCTLEFTPSLAFDMKSKYIVHVRAHEIETSLGRLHGTFEFGFTTS